MTKEYPMVKLCKVAQLRKEFIQIDDLEVYKRCRVQLHAQGIVLRDQVSGMEIKTKRQQVCHAGEFLVAEIDAKVGGFGIVPEELEGAIVSSHYFLFTTDDTLLEKRFLDYFIRTPQFRSQVAAQGSTNYAAIRPADVLGYQIPLPPLAEQRRIVARIEAIAAKIDAARALRRQAAEEGEEVVGSISEKIFTAINQKSVSIGSLISFRNDLIRPIDGVKGTLRFIGLQHIESNTGKRKGEDQLIAEELQGRKFKFSPGEIVYGYLRPYLNKVWVADCEGFCSVDQYVICPNTDMVDVQYLARFMRSPIFLREANELTHNLLLPRLRTALLEGISIPLPPLDEQRRIVAHLDALQTKVDAMNAARSAAAAELDALLPSLLDRAFRGEL